MSELEGRNRILAVNLQNNEAAYQQKLAEVEVGGGGGGGGWGGGGVGGGAWGGGVAVPASSCESEKEAF